MNKQDIKKAIDELKKLPKRKFSQSYDIIINLKNFEVKKNPLEYTMKDLGLRQFQEQAFQTAYAFALNSN